MSDFHQIASDLRQLFKTNFEATGNTAEIHLPNEPEFDYPTDLNGDFLPWVRTNVEIFVDDQMTFGRPSGARFQVEGDIVVETFSPRGRGPGENENLVDDVRTALRNQQTGNIELTNLRSIPVGVVEDIYTKRNVIASWIHFDG